MATEPERFRSVRIPLGQQLAQLYVLPVLHAKARAIYHLVTLLLTTTVIQDGHRTGAVPICKDPTRPATGPALRAPRPSREGARHIPPGNAPSHDHGHPGWPQNRSGSDL